MKGAGSSGALYITPIPRYVKEENTTRLDAQIRDAAKGFRRMQDQTVRRAREILGLPEGQLEYSLPAMRTQLAHLESAMMKMKEANRRIRHNDREGLEQLGFTADQIDRLFEPDYNGSKGFATWYLNYHSMTIKKLSRHILDLEAAKEIKTGKYKRPVIDINRGRIGFFMAQSPPNKIRNMLRNLHFRYNIELTTWEVPLTDTGREAIRLALRYMEEYMDAE